jgi:hypothetical protein
VIPKESFESCPRLFAPGALQMTISQTDVVRGAAIGLSLAAGVGVVAIPLLVWGSEHSPDFFGAFAAAIVAAVAVVLGAYYQASLNRQRDDELRKRDQTAEIVEMYFWLGHAAREMEFIASVLSKMHSRLAENARYQLQMPVEQFREMISAHFMDELLLRAKAASKLPFDLASPLVHVLYGTFSEADRIYRLRGATPEYHPSIEEFEKYVNVAQARTKKLEDAKAEVETYLCTTKGIGRFMDS